MDSQTADLRLKAYSAAAAVVAFDRITKWLIESRVSFYDTKRIIPGFFDIIRSENRGVAFGLFNDSTSEWRTTVLVLISVAAVIAVSAILWEAEQAGQPLALGFRPDSRRRGRQCGRPHLLGTRHRFPPLLYSRLSVAGI